jgi:hypothetical protein
MASEIEVLKAEIARLEHELDGIKAKLKALGTSNGGDEERPFAKLRGIWKGADFTYEEIKAAEYRVPEDDWD